MAKQVIHLSEIEAASTGVATLLSHIRAGAEVVIGDVQRPLAVIRAADQPLGRPISESIALAEAHAKESGHEPAMDPDFAADLEEIINSRKPRIPPSWD